MKLILSLVLGWVLGGASVALWRVSKKRYPRRKALIDLIALVLALSVGGSIAVKEALAVPVMIGVGVVMAVVILIWWICHRRAGADHDRDRQRDSNPIRGKKLNY